MEPNLMDFISHRITSHNPNEKELKLAKERLEFCLKCEFRKDVYHNRVWSHHCGPCGCLINEKIFTIEYGSCPSGKWNIVESNYINHLKIKNKTII